MKYIIVIGDGMADYPIQELGNRTPLEIARTPNMDFIAREGCTGLVETIPENMEPGSDVANLALMGYDPEKYYTGRGPLEAASVGIEMEKGQVAFRCNFITEKDGMLHDFNAGHITTGEGDQLIDALNGNPDFNSHGIFYTGVSYRHLFVTGNGAELRCTPPHDVVGSKIRDILIKPGNDRAARELNQMTLASKEFLSSQPVNIERNKTGKKTGNMIWLWGQGKRPALDNFKEKFGISGSVISAVDLIKGIGFYAGMEVIEVPGATGYYDTDYKAKADFALKTLEKKDFVYIHVEAPDEAGHAGDTQEKIRAIENLDRDVVGRLLERIKGDYKIIIMPDHYTPIRVRTHTRESVPMAIYSPGNRKDDAKAYTEKEAEKGSLGMLKGKDVLPFLLDY